MTNEQGGHYCHFTNDSGHRLVTSQMTVVTVSVTSKMTVVTVSVTSKMTVVTVLSLHK